MQSNFFCKARQFLFNYFHYFHLKLSLFLLFCYHCKMHLYCLKILVTILLCNMIPCPEADTRVVRRGCGRGGQSALAPFFSSKKVFFFWTITIACYYRYYHYYYYYDYTVLSMISFKMVPYFILYSHQRPFVHFEIFNSWKDLWY